MSILLFIAILVVLILVHEFGHFIVAKKLGIRVDEFGLGFPPKLFSFKKGETEYSFNLLPFGGFVRIFGEDPTQIDKNDPDRKRSFIAKPRYVQAVVLIAGVAFNVLLAWVLLSASFMIGMPTIASDDTPVENSRTVILDVLPASPAEEAGLAAGDEILLLRAGDTELAPSNAAAASDFIGAHAEERLRITYKRGDEEGEIFVFATTGLIEESPNMKAIGVSIATVGTATLPPHRAIVEGAKTTGVLLGAVAVAIFSFIGSALTLSADLSQVAGPIGIVGLVGDAASVGLVSVFFLTAVISLNLAIINLLPFPALDGGRLLFVGIEKLKGSPIKPKIASVVNSIGFALLILLLLIVTYSDILRLMG